MTKLYTQQQAVSSGIKSLPKVKVKPRVRVRKMNKLTENRVDGVHCDLVLGGISDETLCISKSDIGGSGSIPLIISDDFHPIVLPHSHTRVRRPQIDSDRCSLAFPSHLNTPLTEQKAIN